MVGMMMKGMRRKDLSPHPNPLPREREPIHVASKCEFDSDFHVGAVLYNNSVSPLSLWERVRVRAIQPCTTLRHFDPQSSISGG